MMFDFNAEFHPTPEQVQEQERFFKQIVKTAYKEKQCITCKHYIPIDPDLPGFVIAFPTCKVTDNIANKTCDKYEPDKIEGEE